MSRRPASLSRRLGEGAGIPFMGSLNPKSRTSPFLSVVLVLVVSLIKLLMLMLFASQSQVISLRFCLCFYVLVKTNNDWEFACDGNFQGAFLMICYIYSGPG